MAAEPGDEAMRPSSPGRQNNTFSQFWGFTLGKKDWESKHHSKQKPGKCVLDCRAWGYVDLTSDGPRIHPPKHGSALLSAS